MNTKEEYIKELLNVLPNAVGIELTTYCQLNCIYCQHEKVQRRNQNMSLEQFDLLNQKIKDFKYVVLCGIGEPTMYPYIYEVVPKLKQDVLLITNGAVKVDFKKLNMKNNVKVVIFSIDEPNEEGMKQIAQNYNWDIMIENLKNVRKSGIMVKMINCTVNRKNYEKVGDLIKFAKEQGLNAINFTFDLYDLEIHKDAIQLMNQYIDAENNDKTSKLIITNSTNSLKCVTWDVILPYVAVNGDVYPCCVGMKEEHLLGNIFDQDFSELFKGERYQKFQKGTYCYTCKLLQEFSLEKERK